MIRIAHLSDPHLGPLPKPTWGELASKRITGYLNWQRNRHKGPRGQTLAAVLADIAAHAPDHICVTGDLMNLGLPGEIPRGLAFLQSLGAPDKVSVIPGNHDAYVPGARAKALNAWAPFFSSDEGSAVYPMVRLRQGVAIIGLSTAVATPPFRATGTLGRKQRAHLADILAVTKAQGLLRLVMLHHPPVHGLVAGYKRLTDMAKFQAIIAAEGAELILHGHSHDSTLTELKTPDGTCPVLGVASASQPFGSTSHDPAAWNEIELSDTGEMRIFRHQVVSADQPISFDRRVIYEAVPR